MLKNAKSLNNLGIHYFNLGDYIQAEPLFTKTLAIRKSKLGDKDPVKAGKLNTLAKLYIKQLNLEKA